VSLELVTVLVKGPVPDHFVLMVISPYRDIAVVEVVRGKHRDGHMVSITHDAYYIRIRVQCFIRMTKL